MNLFVLEVGFVVFQSWILATSQIPEPKCTKGLLVSLSYFVAIIAGSESIGFVHKINWFQSLKNWVWGLNAFGVVQESIAQHALQLFAKMWHSVGLCNGVVTTWAFETKVVMSFSRVTSLEDQ
ncbi:unnamed protein product [Prunus armeniaca]